MKRLSEFVKKRRKEAGLTQEEFAERAGVALTVVRKIEQGKTNLNMDKVNLVLKMFGHELAAVSTKELKKLNRTYFERFGKELGLTNKQIESVFNRLAKNKVKAVEWIQQSFLSDELKEDYLELLEVRYQHIF